MVDFLKHSSNAEKAHSHSLGILFEFSNAISLTISMGERGQETEVVKS